MATTTSSLSDYPLNDRSTVDVVVIGGGLGGLTAGAALANFGRRVLLVERHYIPGGCATTFKRGDFVMEVGLHEMDGLDEADPKREILDLLGVEDHVDLLQVPELYHLVVDDQTELTVPHGTDAYIAALAEEFPRERSAITQMCELMAGVRSEVRSIPEPGWKMKLQMPIFPLRFPNTVKASKHTLGSYLDEHFTSEALKLAIAAPLVYYADDPYQLSLLYFSVAQSSYIAGGGHFVRGGSQKLSNHLAGIIESKGGRVLLGTKATGIELEDGGVSGVTVANAFDGSNPRTVKCQGVIANAAPALIADLLPDNVGQSLREAVGEQEPSCSLLSVYIGFNRPPAELGVRHYSTFFNGPEVDTLGEVAGNLRRGFDERGFVLVDYGQIDAHMAPDGKVYGSICTTDYLSDYNGLTDAEYQDRKEQIAQQLFARCEKRWPGFIDAIERYEVGTARTVARYTNNPFGAPYGFAQTPDQSGRKRFARTSEIDGLYFGSAWTLPGGGFSGAIVAGFLAGLKLHESDRLDNQPAVSFPTDPSLVAVREVRTIATDTIEVVCERPEGFNYEAGQYAVVALTEPVPSVEIDMAVRSLSIASHPGEEHLRFAMRTSASWFKRTMSSLSAGDQLHVYGPDGHFVLPSEPAAPVAYLIGGIGITPARSMILDQLRGGLASTTTLIYSNSTSDAAAYHDEFAAIDDPHFHYVPVATSSDGRIDAALIRREVTDLEDTHFYVVGTSGFLRSMKSMLTDLNVPIGHIHLDDFG